MASYDKYYKEIKYFGSAYKEMLDFFEKYEDKGTLLDLGCGQGRDSLELAKLGYSVTGIDISSVGIKNMLSEAKKNKLNVVGLVEDIYSYKYIDQYNIVFLDSIFHFYKNDKEKESNFLIKILDEMKTGSVLCNLLLKSKKGEEYLKSIISKFPNDFSILKDGYVNYPEANCEYHMFVVRKK